MNQHNSNFFISKRNGILLFFIINVLIQFFYFFSKSNYTNEVIYDGDSIDYQTIAVNYASGHGFMQEGYYINFADYKFDIKSIELIPEQEQSRVLKGVNFLRNPAYPFLVGSIYSVLGVNPEYIKCLQLLLIVISSSMLLIIFRLINAKYAIFKGLLASWLFTYLTYPSAAYILTEPLLYFVMALLLIALIRYYQRGDIWFLGLCFGLAFLAKGIFYFVFISFIFIELYYYIRKRERQQIIRIFRLTLIIFMVILPYILWQNKYRGNTHELKLLKEVIHIADSVNSSEEFYYKLTSIDNSTFKDEITSMKETIIKRDLADVKYYLNSWYKEKNQYVFIVKQGPDVLLACNNELSIDGDWHKEWRQNKNLFYHQINERIPASLKVAMFYYQNPAMLGKILINKFANAFLRDYVASVSVLLIIIMSVFQIPLGRKIAYGFASICLILCFYLLFFGIYPLQNMQLVFGFFLCLSLLFTTYWFIFRQSKHQIFLAFSSVFVGLLLNVFVFYGAFRIISPFYLLLCLILVELSWVVGKKFWRIIQQRI